MLGPEWERTEVEKKISRALEKVAKEVGTQNITAVAIVYVMQKTTHVFPIIGGRKVEHLMANIEALSIALNEEQIKELEAVIPFDAGFPHNFLVSDCFPGGVWDRPQCLNSACIGRWNIHLNEINGTWDCRVLRQAASFVAHSAEIKDAIMIVIMMYRVLVSRKKKNRLPHHLAFQTPQHFLELLINLFPASHFCSLEVD